MVFDVSTLNSLGSGRGFSQLHSRISGLRRTNLVYREKDLPPRQMVEEEPLLF